MAGLCQLNERAAFGVVILAGITLASDAIEPQVGAEDLLIPVGAVGADDYRTAVGRQF